MKNLLRRTAAAVFAFTVVSAAMPAQPLSQVFENTTVTASAAEGDIVDSGTYQNVSWELKENGGTVTVDDEEQPALTLKISGSGNMPAYTSWSSYQSVITSVEIESGVTNICKNAFRFCANLKSVNIPEGVTSIGQGAFRGCTGLTSVDIPEGVTSIGSHAFRGCTGLTSVSIPKSVTSIGSSAFYNCKSLTSVSIPKSVTSIGSSAFCNCESLTSVNILEDVTSIGDDVFDDCTNLTSENIPGSVTSIGNFAFRGCTSLTSVNIPESIESIGIAAFYGCTGLTSVDIPGSVKSIGDGAFYGCTSLTSVNIPGSVTSIADSAFEGCIGLTSVNIPEGVTSIGQSAFYGCTGLTSVNIPESVTIIGNYAFCGCESLTSVNISEGVTSIGEYAFPANASVIIGNIIGNGSQETPYIIKDSADWDEFCNMLAENDKSYSQGKYFRLDSDISVSRTAGSSHHDFCGIFDGNGHTIDFNCSDSKEGVAPFSYAENATIKNLHVTGTINTSNKYASGFVGKSYGTLTIENCRSSITINSSVNGDGTHGGFVGVADNGCTIDNCLFDGKLLGESTDRCGGFVGWSRASVSITNSVFKPSEITVSSEGSATFVRNGSAGENNYAATYLGTEQGLFMSPVRGAETSDRTYDGGSGITLDGSYVRIDGNSFSFLNGTGSETNPYVISSAEEWSILCNALAVNDKSYSIGKYFRLDSDITISETAGSSHHDFCGIFDGNGHTIDFNYSGSEQGIAPFHYAENATIKNLHVTGEINTSSKYAGGIVGLVYGDITLENCRSSVTIKSTVNGDGTHGGLIGVINTGNCNCSINGCLFDGIFEGLDTDRWGGLVGWTNNSMSITDSVFAPESASVNSYNCATFVRNGSVGNNCCYTSSIGSAQGSHVFKNDCAVPEATVYAYYDVSGLAFSGESVSINGEYYTKD